jgi:antitoxin (DNA-binding transcriptional repressor) of toxin-antitoxin stability system
VLLYGLEHSEEVQVTVISVDEAEPLSRQLERVAEGEEIVISRGDRSVAKLVPLPAEPRRPGRLKGKIRISSDFDDPLPDEVMAAFRGEGD